MNEDEWIASGDPDRVIRWLQGGASARKLRLFACACCDWITPLFPERWCREIGQVALAFADGTVTDGDRHRAHLRIKAEYDAKGGSESAIKRMFSAARGAVYGATKPDAGEAAWRAAAHARDARAIHTDVDEPAIQLSLIRDIFGNPFRPVAFPQSWRTDTVVSLARQMYESQNFSAMPILADALQDAGCDNEDVLSHCRTPGEHVRGCWVVDLVLGKE